MRHARGLGGVDEVFPVGAEAHPLGLDADRDLGDDLAAIDVDDGHQVAVFIGDVEHLTRGIEGEVLGVRTTRQITDDLLRGEVEHLDVIAVAGANVERLFVLREQDAARALADGDRFHRR